MEKPSFILITGGELYAPQFLGKKDILIAGEKIVAIENEIDVSGIEKLGLEVVHAAGKKVIPGLIDAHVHIAGAGGEGGPATRTPELLLSQMLTGGITSVVGCLGTDGITRTPDSVLMKAKGLKQEGVSAYIYTGSYQVPTPTITGSISRDLAIIEEVIGVGEIALSDHRSSCPSTPELIRLAGQSRVGAMLGGKSGVINIHMGDAKNPFKPIEEAVKNSELNFKQFYPTHCNRNHYIFKDAIVYGKHGFVDVTASSYPYFSEIEVKPSKAVKTFLSESVPLGHITMTSDGIGSLPGFDDDGNLVKLEMGLPSSIFYEMISMVRDEKLPLEIALSTVTSNVAAILKLKNKGKLERNYDADIVVLNNDFNIEHVFARGTQMIQSGVLIHKGTYE
jgi:beta-aspartyl-dipeptidase (metallo-type)